MPGLHISIGVDNAEDKLNDIMVLPHHRVTSYHKAGSLEINAVEYDGYPMKRLTTSLYEVLIEGAIYSFTDEYIQHEIERLAAWIEDPVKNKAAIGNWLNKTDGEFTMTFIHKEKRTIRVINDALSHLTLYAYQDGPHLRLCQA